LAIAASMNVAGRKIADRCRRLQARPSAASALSAPRVTSSVLPQGCFSTISKSPSRSLTTALPIGAGEPSTTSATSRRRSGTPSRSCNSELPSCSAVAAVERCRIARR
jgi:hypothetical protein